LADTIDRTIADDAGQTSAPPAQPAQEAVPVAHIEHDTNTGISNTKLGMWLFLGSECLLFGGLITTYLLYKTPLCGQGPGPRDMICDGHVVKGVFDVPFTSVTSFCLLASSLTMVLAVSAIERGDHQRLRVWLAATAALGAIFISGQVYEFTAFRGEGLGYSTSRFSSAFYTLTGFHGVHVTVGIIMLLSLFLWSLRGNLPEHRSETVEVIGLYWHFVDVVWIVIFAVVYLIP
jgi:cytochrome c oxidase subunit 3/cytochrome o ubiquinol oxidase subunit 3